jgi:RNA polymerase sigma-70 factor (ECF subfamily)
MILASGRLPSHSSSPDPAALTNAELVHRLRKNPNAAAPILYQRFEPRIRSVVRRMLGPDAEQHDLVQQIFCDLMRSGFELREPDKLPAWIRSVTVCAVYEELRRRRLRRSTEGAQLDRLDRDFVHDVETRDLLVRAVAMIQHLPRSERDAFTLRVVEGRTCDEVAALAGCSTATIKRRLARANRRMRSMIARNAELRKLARRRAFGLSRVLDEPRSTLGLHPPN